MPAPPDKLTSGDSATKVFGNDPGLGIIVSMISRKVGELTTLSSESNSGNIKIIKIVYRDSQKKT